MKLTATALAAFLLCVCAFAQKPEDVAKAMDAKLAAAQSLSATATVTFPGLQPQSWKFEFLKPNYYKVLAPGQEYHSDGKIESIAFTSAGRPTQYSETGRTAVQITDAPFAFGLNHFFKGFADVPIEGGKPDKLGSSAVYALSYQEAGVNGQTVLYIDPTTNLPVGYDEPSSTGTLKVRYSKLRLNPPMDAGAFAWAPPKNAHALGSQDVESKLLPLGTVAPTPKATDLMGMPVDLARIFGSFRSTLVYFWNGKPPFTDLASLKSIASELAGQRFHVIIIDSNVSQDAAKKALNGIDIPFPVIIDSNGSLAKAYGVESTSEFIVGLDGKIGAHFLGYDPNGITKTLRQRGLRI